MIRLLLALYLLEAGLLLSIGPWTPQWSHRVVASAPRPLRGLLASPWLRGFLAGVGVLHLIAGMAELAPDPGASGDTA